MGYNRENYRRIRQEYDGKSLNAQKKAELITREIHEKYPDIKEIDRALGETGIKIMEAARSFKGEMLDKKIKELRAENQALQKDRKACLEYHGLPLDITDVKYECELCSDTGYVGLDMCSCMRSALIQAGYESSGIGNLIKKQNFHNFDLGYYRNDRSLYESMSNNLAVCKNYAETFDAKNSKNLLLMGTTGSGKTHMSTSIAGSVVEKGYDVIYETAQNLFSDFEQERFGRSYNNTEPSSTQKYFDCDLLIVDDLGTEVINQFTVACLYNIINTRLNKEKAMIFNTNLDPDELRKRYADRITSRMFGEFSLLCFNGPDIRKIKLQ